MIVILGCLLLLALLATSFVTLQSIERRVTHNYLDHVRARLVAQSGVEFAIDRLHQAIADGWFADWGPRVPPWFYFGDETDESRWPELMRNPAEAAKLQVGLESAKNPSYSDDPRQIAIDGRSVGFSGIVGGTYGSGSDLYALKVTDCQSQINVNDGARWGNRHSTSQNLRRILNALGAQSTVNISDLGARVIDRRPPGGYAQKEMLLAVLDYDRARYQRVADFLTVSSWTNDKVINPVPLSAQVYQPGVYPVHPGNGALPGDGYARPLEASGQTIFRYGHGRDVTGAVIAAPLRFYDPALEPGPDDLRYSRPTSFYHAVWSHDSLNPQWIESAARSPVNVNTARREVLEALVADLEGFFLLARRRPAPVEMFYGWMWHRYQYGPSGGDDPSWERRGSEIGYLYRTAPFKGSGTVPAGSISASRIVDEILACRCRQASPNIPGLSYAASSFGGPFRTWAQFHEFVDHLVRGGLIVDSRSLYFDYRPQVNVATSWAGYTSVTPWTLTDVSTVASPAQKRLASQAAADVLKANFNPNVTLNELNPDRNLFQLVDKTDLIVHSTEFAFVPMGRFEIESLGYVLRPISSSAFESVARSRAACVVELYRPLHETFQSDFYRGTFGARAGTTPTNNNRSTESGPEPDNGPLPLECSFSGYVALPTSLGCAWDKPKDGGWVTTYQGSDSYPSSVRRAPPGSQAEGFGASMHAHFQHDHVAHHHAGGAAYCLPRGRWPVAAERSSENYPDPSETVRSPYSPVDSVVAGGRPYRLCSTFSGRPTLFKYAPGDLRVDGAYAELHSAFGYDLTRISKSSSIAACFWLKPSWFPENTGKVRTFLSMSNTQEFYRIPQLVWQKTGWRKFSRPLPFGLFYMPGMSGLDDPWIPQYLHGPRNASMLWAVSGDSLTTTTPGGFGCMTPSLTREFEPYFDPAATADFDRTTASGKENHFRDHEWVHVAVRAAASTTAPTYKFPGRPPWPPDSPNRADIFWWYDRPKALTLFVNGRELPGTDQIAVHLNSMWTSLNPLAGLSVRIGGEYSKLGQPYPFNSSTWLTGVYQTADRQVYIAAGSPAETTHAHRLYWADATLDEFFLWGDYVGDALGQAQKIFLMGRYYAPSGDGEFTSQEIAVPRGRRLPAASEILPPAGNATALEPAASSGGSRRVVAMSWTVYTEGLDIESSSGYARPRPYMNDHRAVLSGGRATRVFSDPGPDANGFAYETAVQMLVRVGEPGSPARNYGPFHNEGWSAVGASIPEGGVLNYIARFRAGAAGAVLLATPVLDDVTLFVSEEHAKFVSYAEVNGP
jgi:hypothetical protein